MGAAVSRRDGETESLGTENRMEPASSSVGRTASNWAFPDADGCGTEQAGGTRGLSG